MSIYGFRVLENDDDGDPLDHGVVSAPDIDSAARLVRDHLVDQGLAVVCAGVAVRFYPTAPQQYGVWGAMAIPTDVVVVPADYIGSE
jgi:hypothetical protein